MWTALAILVVVLGVALLLWRVMATGRPTPDENDPDRQHEVPGADGAQPPHPGT